MAALASRGIHDKFLAAGLRPLRRAPNELLTVHQSNIAVKATTFKRDRKLNRDISVSDGRRARDKHSGQDIRWLSDYDLGRTDK